MTRAILISAALLIGLSYAYAIQILPECQRIRDPIGCTCALQNGGFIEAPARGGGRNWWSKRHKKDPVNQAFVECNMRARGQRASQ